MAADVLLRCAACSPRVNAAVQDSLVGKALRQRRAAVILGKGLCKTLFLHAGLSLRMLQMLLRQSAASTSAAHHLDTLNALIAGIVSCNLLHAAFPADLQTKVTNENSQLPFFELCHVHVCVDDRCDIAACMSAPPLQLLGSTHTISTDKHGLQML